VIETGVGLAILGLGAPVTAAIIKLMPQKQNSNGYVQQQVCSVISEDIKSRLVRIENKLDSLREDDR